MNGTVRIPRLNVGEEIFFLAYGIYMVFFILLSSFYAKYIQSAILPCTIFCIALLLVKELLFHSYTRKSVILLFLSVAIGFLMYYSGTATFMLIIVFVYCGRNIRFERIAIFSIMITSITVGFVIVSSYLGIIDNYVSLHIGNERNYLGFLYGLYAPCYLFNITILFLYVKKRAIKWLQILLILAVNYWMFVKCDARISFYLVVAAFVAAIVLKVKPDVLNHKRIICGFMIGSWILCAGFSIYAITTYNGSISWMRELDEFLGGRLSLGQRGLLAYGFSWFGQEVHWVGAGLNAMGQLGRGSYLYVDNLYAKIMIQYGIVLLIIFVLLYTIVMWKNWKDKDFYLLVFLTILSARCIIDDLSLNLYYNTFWFLIGSRALNGASARLRNRRVATATGVGV